MGLMNGRPTEPSVISRARRVPGRAPHAAGHPPIACAVTGVESWARRGRRPGPRQPPRNRPVAVVARLEGAGERCPRWPTRCWHAQC